VKERKVVSMRECIEEGEQLEKRGKGTLGTLAKILEAG
jgi:hypothetical protein